MARNAVLVLSMLCLLATQVQAGPYRPDPERNPDFWVYPSPKRTSHLAIACTLVLGLAVGYGVGQITRNSGEGPELPAPYFSEDSPFQEPPDFETRRDTTSTPMMPNGGTRFDTGRVLLPNGQGRAYGYRNDEGYGYGYEYSTETHSSK